MKDNRAIRGGSWLDWQCFLRSAYRTWLKPSYRGNDLGFRVMEDLGSDCYRAICGSLWILRPGWRRSDTRLSLSPSSRSVFLGFRVLEMNEVSNERN